VKVRGYAVTVTVRKLYKYLRHPSTDGGGSRAGLFDIFEHLLGKSLIHNS